MWKVSCCMILQIFKRFLFKRYRHFRLCYRKFKARGKSFLSVGNAKKLDFEDNSFDLVISINTIHNLEGQDLENSLEIERVSKNKFNC